MPASNVVFDGNSIQNGIYDGGTYAYDNIAYLNCESIVSNNSFAANATTVLTVSGQSTITNNVFRSTTTTFATISAECKISSNKFVGTASTYLSVSANCTIHDNTFTTPAESATFITLSNSRCNITDNKFVRSATSITAYIAISGTSGHQIVDNDFDSTTVNGTSETIISGVANGNVIDRNRNQIHYVTVFPLACAHSHDIGATTTLTYKSTTFVNSPEYYFTYGTLTTDLALALTYNISFWVNLSHYLPKGAKLLGSLIGCRWTTLGGNADTGSAFSSTSTSIYLTPAAKPLNTSFTTPGSTLAGVTTTSTYSIESSAAATAASATQALSTTIQYSNGDYSANSIYCNDTQDIICLYKVKVPLLISPGTSNFTLSSFIFKYVLA